jgi:DNA-binding beta-propeller fold protein YncE/phospholipase C
MKFSVSIAVLLLAALLVSQPKPREQVGPLMNGGALVPNGSVVRPAGTQVALDTMPMSSLVSPDGKYLLVLNGGYKPPSITVLVAASMKEIGRTPVPDGWLGLAMSANGRLVYVGGGARDAVYEFTFSPEGKLEPARVFSIAAERGKALAPVTEKEPAYRNFIGDVKLSPDGRSLFAADLFHDQVIVIDAQSGRVNGKFKSGRRPYRILFHPDGKSFFVSSWADGAVSQLRADTGERLDSIRLGPHTTDIVWREKKNRDEIGTGEGWAGRLFVTSGNTNNVYVVAVSASKQMRLVETINVSLYPNQPAGMTPSAVAFNSDESRLYVVCSDANAVAVADVTEERSHVLGFIPAGWYPTAARGLADGRLLIFNGRGTRSFPNPKGPDPSKKVEIAHLGFRSDEYVGVLQTGSASVIPPFNEEQLAEWSKAVLSNTPFHPRQMEQAHNVSGNPVPMRPGDPSPIEHVVYIVKENRTYDQVLGDIGKGNSDPSLVLFGEKIGPNHHKLAREFVLLDNFYVSADVSADGHNWSTAAIAPDYVQRMWPNSYGGRRKHYDYEGGEPAAVPPAGYIWNNVLAKGLTMRNFGYFVNIRKEPAADGRQIESVRDPSLAAYTNMDYRGFDLNYHDEERAKVFVKDLAQMESSGQMPRFTMVRLGNDHTSGTAAGKWTPLASFADNDYAFGMIVEAISRSKFWPKTAIFVLEDDAQNGPDHVDSHRSPAYVISPYVKRGTIDSTIYNTTSMLRTMELILGLRPMTMWDAGSVPMTSVFQAQADPAPYEAVKPRVSTEDRNPAHSATAARSNRMNFEEADDIDDDELNDILWRSIRSDPPPVPVRSYFSR